MILISLQPLAHTIVCEGYGDQDGDAGELQEFAGKQTPEIDDTGAQNFPYADLFCALFGYESGETEKPETGDKDRQAGEDGGKIADTLFGFEIGGIGFVDEMI